MGNQFSGCGGCDERKKPKISLEDPREQMETMPSIPVDITETKAQRQKRRYKPNSPDAPRVGKKKYIDTEVDIAKTKNRKSGINGEKAKPNTEKKSNYLTAGFNDNDFDLEFQGDKKLPKTAQGFYIQKGLNNSQDFTHSPLKD